MNLQERVVHIAPVIRPGGGPYGYLHSLEMGLLQIRSNKVTTWAPNRYDVNGGGPPTQSRLRDAIARRLPHQALARMLPYFRTRNARRPQQIPRSILESRALVFHSIDFAAQYLANSRPSGQKIWVMSHSPTTISTEVVRHWRGRLGESRHWADAERRVEELELRTYEMADGILLPCKPAVDAYFVGDANKRTRFERLHSYELLSGVPASKPARSRDEVRRQLGVPSTTCLIGFVGRYHTDKGFDIFLGAARRAAESADEKLMFVSAGGGPQRTSDVIPNYMDLGWQSSNLADFVRAFDIVVSPNRVTYFDLGLLEAMSLGVPLLVSNTGGNQTLAGLSTGVLAFSPLSPDLIISEIRGLVARKTLTMLGLANRVVYENLFTEVALARRHEEFAEKLLTGSTGVAHPAGLSSIPAGFFNENPIG